MINEDQFATLQKLLYYNWSKTKTKHFKRTTLAVDAPMNIQPNDQPGGTFLDIGLALEHTP